VCEEGLREDVTQPTAREEAVQVDVAAFSDRQSIVELPPDVVVHGLDHVPLAEMLAVTQPELLLVDRLPGIEAQIARGGLPARRLDFLGRQGARVVRARMLCVEIDPEFHGRGPSRMKFVSSSGVLSIG